MNKSLWLSPTRPPWLFPCRRPNPAPHASIDKSKKPPSVKATVGGIVDYAGTGLEAVTAIKVEANPVPFATYAAGTALSAVIDGSLIPTSGTKELQFELPTGGPLKASLLIMENR